MSVTPMSFAESLRIGTVDFVSPDEIRVLLELDAPNVVALNSSSPLAFPRINGYLLIPSDGGFLVGQIEWISVERSPFPKQRGMQDFGLIDLPYPLRKLSMIPLGTLKLEEKNGSQMLKFRRGADAFPTVGEPVLLPTPEQLRRIIESGENRHVWIGRSPLAADAKVCIDPDRLFGRHLAVLGNTGSGKSCSVAGLIRWSMEAAEASRKASNSRTNGPNARFIVLDPNGEYAHAFSDLVGTTHVKRFAVEPTEGIENLNVPLWFWNSEEWCAFTQAAPKTQRPVLIQALRAVRDGAVDDLNAPSTEIRRFLRTIAYSLRITLRNGDPWTQSIKSKGVHERLEVWLEGLKSRPTLSTQEEESIRAVTAIIERILSVRTDKWSPFKRSDILALHNRVLAAHSACGGTDKEVLPIDANTPRPFTGQQLLRSVEGMSELLNATEHTETLRMRIQTLLSDTRMRSVFQEEKAFSLEDWLSTYIGDDSGAKASLTIIDLSLIPADAIHIITAVIARMVLEALQRYRKLKEGNVLPTVLVIEEAHTFVRQYKEHSENHAAAVACCQVFERIAREGRKFGLGLVLSSQRPSELSPTVLSQCNTFLLHRISNDRDQELVHKLVPDNLRGLLRDLPSLPARQAVLLGWASELPILVEMRQLSDDQRPRSNDPEFWKVWSRQIARRAEWESVAREWQQQHFEEE